MPASFEHGGMRWWPSEGAAAGAALGAVGRAKAALASGAARRLKAGRRKELYLLAGERAPDLLVKVNRYQGLSAARRRAFGSKARRELRLAERIALRGVATPVPLAAGELRCGGRVLACWLVVPFIAGARDLRRVALLEPPRRAARRELARAFGAFARRLHDAGVEQEDFQPNNFLLGPRGPDDLLLVDCERLRLRTRIGGRARARMLAKLERELGAATRLAERARFLRAYVADDRAAFRATWRAVEAEAARLARRDAARLARRPGRRPRRFAPIASGPWWGVRSVSADQRALERDLAALASHAAEGERGAAPPRSTTGPGAAERSSARARAAPGAPDLSIREARDHFALGFPAASARDAAGALGLALVLAKRGLAPAPVAALRSGDRALLVFRGCPPARLDASAAGDGRARRAALARLLARLLSLGELAWHPAALLPFLACPSDGSAPLQLLAPPLLRLTGRPGADVLRRSRALAASILGS